MKALNKPLPPRCKGADVLRTPLQSRSTDRGGSRMADGRVGTG